ncbi:MAG: branched-chain amino acid ABC transporter permease [Rhizobiales bacterium]|nr:branched-chain amino acid ABC transporter permease [Hyphomicrobiales bacterium]
MRSFAFHACIVLALFALQFVLPPYHHANAARIMVYAVLAVGYNVLLGYTGLMSLGHAMFFAAGAYGAGISIYWFGFDPIAAFVMGLGSGLALSLVTGIFLLRSTGVAFLIVTLMLSQAFFLSTLYFNGITLGEQGMVLSNVAAVEIFGIPFRLSDPAVKYNLATAAFAVSLFASLWLVRSPLGRVLIAIRENEPRTRMLGYNTFAYRYLAIAVSGTIAGLSGALYCLLFSYVGSSFASLQYSTLPLLWTLLGGAGTIIGPLIGTGVMFYLVDISSSFTSSYLLVVGVTLLALTLWFPKGIAGMIRARWLAWLP